MSHGWEMTRRTAKWQLVGAVTVAACLGAAALGRAQFTSFNDRSRAMLEGHWQSCREADGRYSERVYDHIVNGVPKFEVHMGPKREFAIFEGVQEEHRAHESPANLLRPYRLDVEGKHTIEECEGNGPVDAVFNCVKAMVPHEAVLELYQVHAVTEGTDAQAEVSVRLSENGRSVTSKGADPDTLVASAKAYLGALNKLIIKRNRGMGETLVVGERRIHSTDVG